MNMAAILSCDLDHLNKLLFPRPKEAHISEEKMFENVDTHIYTHLHTYGRQRPTYTISSPMSLKAISEEKMLENVDTHTCAHTHTHTDDRGLPIL